MHRKVINQKYLQPLLDFFNDTVFRYFRVNYFFYDSIISFFIPFHCKQELDIGENSIKNLKIVYKQKLLPSFLRLREVLYVPDLINFSPPKNLLINSDVLFAIFFYIGIIP